jgi:hypothetical protein
VVSTGGAAPTVNATSGLFRNQSGSIVLDAVILGERAGFGADASTPDGDVADDDVDVDTADVETETDDAVAKQTGTLKTLPRTVAEWRDYFLENTEVGALTAEREGRRNRAYVPNRGEGVGRNSHVTIGIGVEIRDGNASSLGRALGGDPALTSYLNSVPDLIGRDAQEWVERNEGPTLTPAQVEATYTYAARVYGSIARARLTGESQAHQAVPGVRLTAQEHADLDRRVTELLADLALNTRVIADGRQNDIAGCLRAGLAMRDVSKATRTYEQFRQLRAFVAGLPGNLQGGSGRMKRLGWIDARMKELLVQVDSAYLTRLNSGVSP